jgi:hypothetical protein
MTWKQQSLTDCADHQIASDDQQVSYSPHSNMIEGIDAKFVEPPPMVYLLLGLNPLAIGQIALTISLKAAFSMFYSPSVTNFVSSSDILCNRGHSRIRLEMHY